MNVDVLITSCARPDVLERTVKSFKNKIKTSCDLRYILVEDKVNNENRQNVGKQWINKHKGWFDEIIFHDRKVGKGFWWQEILKICKTPYHIHLEDDNEFINGFKIDLILEIMQKRDDIIEVIFSRGAPDKRTQPQRIMLDGLKLTEMKSMSIASGIFDTEKCKKVVDILGWKTMVHEAGNLTPTTIKLGYRKFILGHGKKHYEHIGAKLGYNKGKWKK